MRTLAIALAALTILSIMPFASAMGFSMMSYLNTTSDANLRPGMMAATLSNGSMMQIRVFPASAAEQMMSQLNASCYGSNCTVELKEEGYGEGNRAVYVVHADRDVKFLGMMRMRMPLAAVIDARTGEVIRVERPWWAFLSGGANITGNAVSAAYYDDDSDGDSSAEKEKANTSTSASATVSLNVSANSSVKAGSAIYTKNSYRAISRSGMDEDSGSSSSQDSQSQQQTQQPIWECPYLTE